ncbi:MAG: T9SS type A sorting domain-containing protein [Bacteroidota bacterium]
MYYTTLLRALALLLATSIGLSLFAQEIPAIPTDPPLIISDRGEGQQDPNDSETVCFPPNAGNTVNIFYEFHYVLDGPISHYVDLVFNFTIEDVNGNPLSVTNFPGAVGNTFEIDFDNLGNITTVPSGPYNVRLDSWGDILIFDLAFTTQLPSNYPTTRFFKIEIQSLEELKGGHTLRQYMSTFPLICNRTPPNPKPPLAYRVKDNYEENQTDILKLFPNPVQHELSIEVLSEEEENPEMKVIDMQGKVIPLNGLRKYLGNGQWHVKLDTESLSPGMYIYTTKVGGQIYRKKFVKVQ